MTNQETVIITYPELLKRLQDQDSHLLLWNWFNRWLGVDTSYQAIFNQMIQNDHWIYKDAIWIIKESNSDLEIFIWKLTEDIPETNIFLRKYVANKVKHDFMKAAHEIVKDEIKNIYAEKNEWIYVLLQNFKNYFTLNYDSFLYLLLLNFKNSSDKRRAIAIQSSLRFIEQDLNEAQTDIYSEIKDARNKWNLKIHAWKDSEDVLKSMSELTKSDFVTVIKQYAKSNKKSWKTKDINKVIDSLWEEEKNHKVLENINDGMKEMKLFDDSVEYVFDSKNETQNLFFLHGAFHIYRDWKEIKKITQKSDRALYDRLEEILNDEEMEVICVFQSENKIDTINENQYLKNSYNKLWTLSGTMVIIGSSLAENDKHIFDQINNSKIHTVYISTRKESISKTMKKAKMHFPDKEIILFETESISYELPTP
jgi:hypothetical protein